MPLYEYICTSCQARFELYVRAWSEAVVCPACQAGDVEKQLSRFAFTGSADRLAATGGGGCGCGRGSCGCHR